MPRQLPVTIIDISRPLAKTEPVYPGNAPFELAWLKKFSKDGSNLSSLRLGTHTATHLDAPLHYLKKGSSVEKINLSRCVGWARVIDATKTSLVIDERFVQRIRPQKEEILLFKTKNSSQTKGGKFNPRFVHINEGAARLLIKSGVKCVGIDGPSIRQFRLKPDTVHPLLSRAGVLIYEGLLLREARPGRYFFIGVPLKIVGAEGSPVRAILLK